MDQVDELAAPDLAPPHAADHDAPEVLGVVEIGDEHLEGGSEVDLRGGDLLQHRLEQLPHVVPRLVQAPERPALASNGVEDREVELFVRGAEIGHQVEGEVDDLVGTGVHAVDLVYDHDRLET